MIDTKIEKLEKKLLYREEIKSAIMDAIMSGMIKPGERIVETRWAKNLGVSQSPIREALRELEMIGIVETIPYKGCIVCESSSRELIDGLKVRTQLEIYAVEELFEKMDFSFVERMQDRMEGMRKAVEAGDMRAFSKEDSAFHREMVEGADNKPLLRLWDQISTHDATHVTAVLTDRPMGELCERHQIILDELMSHNLSYKKQRIIEAIHAHFATLIKEVESSEAR